MSQTVYLTSEIDWLHIIHELQIVEFRHKLAELKENNDRVFSKVLVEFNEFIEFIDNVSWLCECCYLW